MDLIIGRCRQGIDKSESAAFYKRIYDLRPNYKSTNCFNLILLKYTFNDWKYLKQITLYPLCTVIRDHHMKLK